ncbi:hypothetical protein MYA_3014 [Burkholderia sp. KJ006]|nr:hypothetical protein MYA_3014 [Burkholderia sp. KJ006]
MLLSLCLFHVLGPGRCVRPVPTRSMTAILGIGHKEMILF